jgi:DNA-binding beta-propeller fold protein YncE
MTFDGKYLWIVCSDGDKICQINESGNVLTELSSPQGNPRGLTWDGQALWLSVAWAQDGIYQIDIAGNVLKKTPSPTHQPSGLAWADGALFIVETHGRGSPYGNIYKLDPASGKVLLKFQSPGDRNEGLAYDGKNLLLVSSVRSRFYRINPSSGQTVEEGKSALPSPTGVAWDGKNVWVSSATEDKIQHLSFK